MGYSLRDREDACKYMMGVYNSRWLSAVTHSAVSFWQAGIVHVAKVLKYYCETLPRL